MSDAVVGGLVGTLGTVLAILVRWLLQRGPREAARQAAEIKQQKAIDDGNTRLAAELRDELRVANKGLQAQVREMELRLAATDAKQEVMQRDNDTLRHENFTLKGENGELKAQVVTLTEKAKRQEVTNDLLMGQMADMQADRLTLIDAMRAAKIDIPPLSGDRRLRRTDTGPLVTT